MSTKSLEMYLQKHKYKQKSKVIVFESQAYHGRVNFSLRFLSISLTSLFKLNNFPFRYNSGEGAIPQN